jgi:gamma-glutamyltranspeptidase/glutathione hydrolase
MYLDEDGNVIDGLSLKGGLAVGIPGAVDGMATLHREHGHLPMKDILREVIPLAKNGFKISEEEAGRLNGFKKAFQEWNTEAIPFVKDEEWSTGDVLRQVALAKTLKGISRQGADYFYSGTAAQHLVDRIQDKGGIASMEDLANYESVWRDPIVFEYEGHEVYSMPPPSSGGTTLAQILTMYGMIKGTGGLDPNVHALVEAERRAFADRASFLGDPDYVQVPLDTLLDGDYLRRRISDFEPGQASSSEEIKEGSFDWNRESFETTHFCVADKDGNVASVTTTLNSNFGSKVFVPELGFFLNNEMDDFSAKPGVPNQFGLIGNDMNAIAPGKRMLSSMTPTIVEKDGDFFLALGTPGGSTIITTVAQVMLRVIDDDASLLDAVSAPRFHHQWWPDVVMHEEGLAPSLKVDLSNRGHQLRALQKLGLVEAILQSSDGTYIGVADPRSGDHAAGVE